MTSDNAACAARRKKLVVVLGMHRSGTSAITCCLQALGVSLGDHLLPAAQDNDKGFWEDLDIIELNAGMLAALGRDWHSLRPVTDRDVESLLSLGYLEKALQLLREKTVDVSVFGFKDPRTTKLLPFWQRVFEDSSFDVQYILSSRNPLSVVKSLGKRDGFSRERSFMLWLEYSLAALCNVAFGRTILVDYDELIAFPRRELERVSDFLGLPLLEEKVGKYCDEFLEKSLRHSYFDENDVYADEAALPLAKEVYALLLDIQRGIVRIEDGVTSGLFLEWKERLGRVQPLLVLIDRQEINISKAREAIMILERKFMIIPRALRKIKESGRRLEFFVRSHSHWHRA